LNALSQQRRQNRPRARTAGGVIAGCALILLAGGLSGCDEQAAGAERPCSSTADCDRSWVCHRALCAKSCNSSGECPQGIQVCADGVCQGVPNPGCESDADCVDPHACAVAEGAACVAAACRYQPATEGSHCDDTDPCTRGDTCTATGICQGEVLDCRSPSAICHDSATLRVYTLPGLCAPDLGECRYTYLRDESCVAAAGGCTTNGRCAETPEAHCAYDDAADGTPCDLDAAVPDEQPGLCSAGLCVECLQVSDCGPFPVGRPDCYDVTCDARKLCVYTLRQQRVCEAARCDDGVRTPEQLCGITGECPAIAEVDCGGLACDANGQDCLTSCQLDEDCVGGFRCQPDGGCGLPQPIGAPCATDVLCESGHCADGTCCASACAGGCDRCDVSGREGECLADDALCLGSCDRCDTLSGSCVAEPGLCHGSCAICTGSGGGFSCRADPGLCGGNCAVCSGSSTSYSCEADPADPCVGDCAVCAQQSATDWRCAAEQSSCDAICSGAVCSGSALSFSCDLTACPTCSTASAPKFDGDCGSGLPVDLLVGCRYTWTDDWQTGSSVGYEYQTYECTAGGWILIDSDSDGWPCSQAPNCASHHYNEWEDDCGNGSYQHEDC